jgi:hypothetical protein
MQGKMKLIDWVAYTKEATVSELDFEEIGASKAA